jgi:hypothetical protein
VGTAWGPMVAGRSKSGLRYLAFPDADPEGRLNACLPGARVGVKGGKLTFTCRPAKAREGTA